MRAYKPERVADDFPCAGIIIADVEGMVTCRMVQYVERHIRDDSRLYEGVEVRVQRGTIASRPRHEQRK